MQTKQIYLIRHGETDLNRRNIVQGSGVDSSLNDLGRAQAAAFFRHYQHVPFVRVYTSVLQRAIQSVQAFLDLGIPHTPMPALNEISWGANEGKAVTAEGDTYYFDVLRQWREGNVHLPVAGGESPWQVAQRQQAFIEAVRQSPAESPVLVCMHGRAMRILLCQLMGQSIQEMDMYEHSNLCLYVLHYAEGKFSIEQANDISHLADLAQDEQ